MIFYDKESGIDYVDTLLNKSGILDTPHEDLDASQFAEVISTALSNKRFYNEKVRHLKSKLDEISDYKDTNGNTFLIKLIWGRSSNSPCSRGILDVLSARSINAQNKIGMTALMYASSGQYVLWGKHGNARIVSDLLELGANPLLKDKNGNSAYDHSVKHLEEEESKAKSESIKGNRARKKQVLRERKFKLKKKKEANIKTQRLLQMATVYWLAEKNNLFTLDKLGRVQWKS